MVRIKQRSNCIQIRDTNSSVLAAAHDDFDMVTVYQGVIYCNELKLYSLTKHHLRVKIDTHEGFYYLMLKISSLTLAA